MPQHRARARPTTARAGHTADSIVFCRRRQPKETIIDCQVGKPGINANLRRLCGAGVALIAAGVVAVGWIQRHSSSAETAGSAPVGGRAASPHATSVYTSVYPTTGQMWPAPTPDKTTIATPSGEFLVQGPILQEYNRVGSATGPLGAVLGGASSPLGVPTSDEQPGPRGGRYSTFSGGAIYWSPTTGAHAIWGRIRDAWERSGGPAGPVGYPTSDEQIVSGGWEQRFQYGTITWTDGPHIDASPNSVGHR